MAVPCPFSKLHPQQKSWSLATQMRTETRSKFEFPIRTSKFLFFAIWMKNKRSLLVNWTRPRTGAEALPAVASVRHSLLQASSWA